MNALLMVLLLFITSPAHSDNYGLEVRRILSDYVQEKRAGEEIRFWREVCISEEMHLTVSRTIKDLSTVPATYIEMPSVVYHAFHEGGCRASIYSLSLPTTLEEGSYIYEPVGILDNGSTIRLPTEKFRIIK